MENLKLETKIPKTNQSELRKRYPKKWTELVEQEKRYSICVIKVPEGEEKSAVLKKCWNYAENFPSLVKDMNLQIQEVEWILIVLTQINPYLDTS